MSLPIVTPENNKSKSVLVHAIKALKCGSTPFIPNLDTWYSQCLVLRPSSFTPGKCVPVTLRIGCLVEPRVGVDRFGETENLLFLLGIEPRFLEYPFLTSEDGNIKPLKDVVFGTKKEAQNPESQ